MRNMLHINSTHQTLAPVGKQARQEVQERGKQGGEIAQEERQPRVVLPRLASRGKRQDSRLSKICLQRSQHAQGKEESSSSEGPRLMWQ
jgi:hypothetical protein